MEIVLEKFVNSIKEMLGDNLVSIVLYGSKAGDMDSASKSDYNVLLVLKEVVYENLEKLDAKILSKWIKSGNPMPLIFTQNEIARYLNVFPMEFLDISGSHRVLYGPDLFQDIIIDIANLRHECEYELRSKLLSLRRDWLVYSRNNKALKALLTGSISSFLSIFRHVVKLAGEAVPSRKLDALEILKKRCGTDPELFHVVYKIKHGDKGMPRYDPDDLMRKYLKELEKIIIFLDNL